MEIFAGFSIRPWSTPCPTPESSNEGGETGFFSKSRPDSSFAIFSSRRKNMVFFERSAFEQQQVRNAGLSEKEAEKACQMEKQSNRKLVQKVKCTLHSSIRGRHVISFFILQILK
jgi:hypothetical protein